MEISDRVAAGAAWLDTVDAWWFKRMNLETFNLRSECDCVLGQLAMDIANVKDGYFAVIEGRVPGVPQIDVDDAIKFGFLPFYDDWDHVERVWRDVIDRRQKLGA